MPTYTDLLKAPSDEITADDHNGVLRWAVIICTSTTRPTDATQGMHVYETDTGRRKIFDEGAGIWVDDAWLTASIDYAGDAILGTKPDPILEIPPVIYERSIVLNVANTSGGWNAPYPNPFPNCILGIQCTVGDDASDAAALQLILTNCDLANLNGQVFQSTGDVVANGDPFRLNYRVVGC